MMPQLEEKLMEHQQKIDKHEEKIEKTFEEIKEAKERIRTIENDRQYLETRFDSIENKYEKIDTKLDKYNMEQIGLLKTMINHSQSLDTAKVEDRRINNERTHEIAVRLLAYIGAGIAAIWALFQFVIGM